MGSALHLFGKVHTLPWHPWAPSSPVLSFSEVGEGGGGEATDTAFSGLFFPDTDLSLK